MAINIPALSSVWFQDAGVATSSSMEHSACVRVFIYPLQYTGVCV